jgi:hypothetical protein
LTECGVSSKIHEWPFLALFPAGHLDVCFYDPAGYVKSQQPGTDERWMAPNGLAIVQVLLRRSVSGIINVVFVFGLRGGVTGPGAEL